MFYETFEYVPQKIKNEKFSLADLSEIIPA